jgi:hypothetical protein
MKPVPQDLRVRFVNAYQVIREKDIGGGFPDI